MTTEFPALCAELLDEFVYHTDWSDAEELKERARAALADEPAAGEPASVTGQPSDEELLNFARNQEPWKTWLHPGGCLESAHCEVADLLSAVLARWGNPAPAPPADGEVAELVAWLREQADHELGSTFDADYFSEDPAARNLNRAADLLQRLSPPQPVPGQEVEG